MITIPIKKCLPQVRRVFVLGAAVMLAACSYTYELRVTVVPGEQVDAEAIAEVSIIIAKAPHQRSQLSSMTALPVDDDGVFTTEICCTPNPEIWIYAFHDANRSGFWDSDEPMVADSASPVRLSDDYTLTLTMP